MNGSQLINRLYGSRDELILVCVASSLLTFGLWRNLLPPCLWEVGSSSSRATVRGAVGGRRQGVTSDEPLEISHSRRTKRLRRPLHDGMRREEVT